MRLIKRLIFRENLERAKGIEPSTYSLGSCRSTTELRPHALLAEHQVGGQLSSMQSSGRVGPEVLRQLEALPLIVRSDILPIDPLRRLGEPLIDQPADDL